MPSGSIQRISASTPVIWPVGELDRPAGSAGPTGGARPPCGACVTNCSLADGVDGAARRDDVAGRARLLALVHRGLRVAEQSARIAAVLRVEADAHAGRDVELGRRDHERRRQRLLDVLHDRLGADHRRVHVAALLAFQVGEQQQELVASPTRDQIGLARGFAQAIRHHLQELVPVVMAEAVVDQREIVEVEDRRRRPTRAWRSARSIDRLSSSSNIDRLGRPVSSSW